MSRITDYPIYTECDAPTSDNFIIDSLAKGTRRTRYRDVSIGVQEIYSQMHISYRRNIFSPVNLGTTFTEDQNAALSGTTPTFTNLYVGSYWTINGHKYIIADFDYWYNIFDIINDTMSENKHHLTVVLSNYTNTYSMNDTDTVDGGYVGSKMYTEYLPEIQQIIEQDWGDHLMTHRSRFANAVSSDGIPSANAWYDTKIELMNEIMAYGHSACAPVPDNKANYDLLAYARQLALCKYSPVFSGRSTHWLRDVAAGGGFCCVNATGTPYKSSATYTKLVRPVFAIKAT